MGASQGGIFQEDRDRGCKVQQCPRECNVRSSWQAGPLSPGVGFRCRAARAGEDLVEPFQCFLAQRETQDAYRAV